MIDNIDKIKNLLKFENEHDFYFLQIIQRKKDLKVKGANNSSRLIKAYYIHSIDQLDKYYKEITTLCKVFEARACINLNKRNSVDISLEMLSRLATNIKNNHPGAASSLFNHICGEFHSEKDKKWIVDIDHKNRREINEVVAFIELLQPYQVKDKFIDLIESKNGFHIISKPFNMEKFKESYPEIDCHKNNPTNLYIP